MEGLFWLVCHMDGDVIDWNEDWEIYHIFIKSDAIYLMKESDKNVNNK